MRKAGWEQNADLELVCQAKRARASTSQPTSPTQSETLSQPSSPESSKAPTRTVQLQPERDDVTFDVEEEVALRIPYVASRRSFDVRAAQGDVSERLVAPVAARSLEVILHGLRCGWLDLRADDCIDTVERDANYLGLQLFAKYDAPATIDAAVHEAGCRDVEELFRAAIDVATQRRHGSVVVSVPCPPDEQWAFPPRVAGDDRLDFESPTGRGVGTPAGRTGACFWAQVGSTAARQRLWGANVFAFNACVPSRSENGELCKRLGVPRLRFVSRSEAARLQSLDGVPWCTIERGGCACTPCTSLEASRKAVRTVRVALDDDDDEPEWMRACAWYDLMHRAPPVDCDTVMRHVEVQLEAQGLEPLGA